MLLILKTVQITNILYSDVYKLLYDLTYNINIFFSKKQKKISLWITESTESDDRIWYKLMFFSRSNHNVNKLYKYYARENWYVYIKGILFDPLKYFVYLKFLCLYGMKFHFWWKKNLENKNKIWTVLRIEYFIKILHCSIPVRFDSSSRSQTYNMYWFESTTYTHHYTLSQLTVIRVLNSVC